ncbi:MAG: hypothetical protein LC798_05345 [Chloroflexi bacterium]|nr:hypothetical protein [Chloroflexota bacterium]
MSFRRGATTTTGVLTAIVVFPALVFLVIFFGLVLIGSGVGFLAHSSDDAPPPPPPAETVLDSSPSGADPLAPSAPAPAPDPSHWAALKRASVACQAAGGSFDAPGWAWREDGSYNALWCTDTAGTMTYAQIVSAQRAATEAFKQ